MEPTPELTELCCQGIFTSAHTPKESSRAKTDSDMKGRSLLTRVFKKEEECCNHMIAREL